jgi:hypothetical protein
VSGNSLIKTAATAWGNAGAVSTKSIPSGNGYVEFTATETNTYRMLGLSNGNSSVNYDDIDFAIYPAMSGQLFVYEKGAYRGAFGSYASGDKLRVSLESGIVKYMKNGTVVYTSGQAPTYPLLVDTAFYSTGATVTSAVLSGNWTAGTPPPSGNEAVVWTAASGVAVSGNSLTKTAATAWGNAGAVSTKAIASGNGYVEFTANETTTYRMLGLSNGDSSQNYDDIDFGLYLLANDHVYVYEKGVSRGQFGKYVSGDRLRVSVESGVVKYLKNGAVIYTSSQAPTFPLLVDTAFYSNGATIAGAVVSGNWTAGAPGPSGSEAVAWTGAVGVSVSGSSLTKTAASAWGNGGAASTKSISSGEGWVEFTATENTSYRMLGLSNGNSSANYDDVDFAIYPCMSGQLQVYEKGSFRGSFGTYAPGDKLKVAVVGGVVKYMKNGTVVYTSGMAPVYPLLVDSALYSNGATVTSAAIGGGSWQ